MRPRMMFFRPLLMVGALLCAAGPARAQLAANSPFVPPQNSGPAAPTQNAPLEFRAVLETPEGVLYRVADPTRKSGGGVWVKLNERNPEFGVLAKAYDPERETLTVEHEGRTMTLEIRKAKIVSSGPAAQVMTPTPTPAVGNMLPSVTQTVVANPSPAEEQKRLEAVAQEVARRRALREQAQTQVGQPTPVAAPQNVQSVVQPPPQRLAPQNTIQTQQNQVQGRRGGPAPRQR